jgi:CRISPR type III-A-associated protein Csm2
MEDAFKKAGYKGRGNLHGRHHGQERERRQSGQKNPPPEIVFRTNGQLRREILTSEAEVWADLLYDNKKGVTSTQLRNFFNEVKALQSRIEAGGFTANEAMIGLLKSKAAYAYARAEKKRKQGFDYLKSMIEQGVDLIFKSNDPKKSEEAFYDFALFFEAVMGFFKGR